jgi:electron-transferring-flavoprotein dehydrogenase
VVGLDYQNPYESPYEEFQRYKTHPEIRKFFEGGKRIAYGARAITAGGLQSLPKTVFPGGALIGCDAGFLNASRIKGSHAAIKTGMLAADAAFDALGAMPPARRTESYPAAFEQSWLHEELHSPRNFKPWMSKGLYRGHADDRHRPDAVQAARRRGRCTTASRPRMPEPAASFKPIVYPKPDGKLTFDRLSSVFISNTNHAEDQPVHLTLKNPACRCEVNLAKYAGPEQRYCPAGVYEFVKTDEGQERCRSMRRTACTARPATSRTRPRTSCGSPRKAAAGRTTRTCNRNLSGDDGCAGADGLTADRDGQPQLDDATHAG